MTTEASRRDDALLRPLRETGAATWMVAAVLLAIVAWGGYAYYLQLRDGLAVTGLGRPVYWGVYIINLIYFIGVSYGGTLASAVLRLTGAEWRRAITRTAEATTVCALLVGGPQPLVDLGRIDRVGWIFLHPNFSSPMIWDILSISTYLMMSALYLWLALLPDLAWLRDAGVGGPIRRRIYHLLAAGFTGEAAQRRRLDMALGVMAVIIIPIAISAHTVLAWVPGLSIVPMWHSALMGPYFVLGAVFSGIATIILALALVRKAYRLESLLEPMHFEKLAWLLLTLSALWTYFTFAEHLTALYGELPEELHIARDRVFGQYSRLFWAMVVACGVSPLLLAIRPLRTVSGTCVVSLLVLVGMWAERFLILVPSEARPRLPIKEMHYLPTWIEWAETAASMAAFGLLFLAFTKMFPVISRWEARKRQVAYVAVSAGQICENGNSVP